MEYSRKIVLEDGSEYPGYGFGGNGERVCEIVFCTAMVGYQELLSDPSCTNSMVVMTYPVIGNYGIADDDFESKNPTIGGLIVREYNDNPSNFRYTRTLSEIMEEHDIPGIYGVDTRMLTKKIRDGGSQKALITGIDTAKEDALNQLKRTELPKDAVSLVSCKKRWYSRTPNHQFNVVAIDCGIKLNIIRCLSERGCNVTVMPWNTQAQEIEAINPDGVLLSNGPGDPRDVGEVVRLIQNIRGRYPIFGISLGYLLIALAYGAKTYKMKFGHHGGNHPVKNLRTGKIEIAAQNHTYAVDADSIAAAGLECTHINLLDQTPEGIACAAERVFGVQHNSESAPGPQDSAYLFEEFIENMREARENA